MNDPALIEQLNRGRPRHIVATIGGGTQERLGLYLRQELDYSPAIHCVGAAIAFLSGDQVHIPVWADRMYWDGCCVPVRSAPLLAALLGCAQAPHPDGQTSQQPASFRHRTLLNATASACSTTCGSEAGACGADDF